MSNSYTNYLNTQATDFITDIHNIFLYGSQLVTVGSSKATAQTPLNFLDVAMKILRNIRINVKFAWKITIAKESSTSAPTIKVTFIDKKAQIEMDKANKIKSNDDNKKQSQKSTLTPINNRIEINPSPKEKPLQISIPENNDDSYVINEILHFGPEPNVYQTVIKKQNDSKYTISSEEAVESNSNKPTKYIMDDILHKMYESKEQFNITIMVYYKKSDSKTIIIEQIIIDRDIGKNNDENDKKAKK